MFNILASLGNECERLGLSEEAKIIKAWVSARLPHMTEETQFVHELFDLYQTVSKLKPDAIIDQNFGFRNISYSTQGKTVRKVMGEIGYLLHAVYEDGYLRHSMYDMKRENRQNHIQFGLLLQSLVGLFGIYYNCVNKEDVVEQELAQMTDLFNTSIASMLGNLQREFAHVKGAARAMLQSGNNSHFNEDNQEIVGQAEDFFTRVDEMMLLIRDTFYHARSRLISADIEAIRNVLNQLYTFYKSLDDLDSHLDLEGRQYSPKALMYWSIVFSKDKKKSATQRQQRREVINEISGKPYLNEYAGTVEITSQLLRSSAQDYIKRYRDFNQVVRALSSLNTKIYNNLTDLLRMKGRTQEIRTAVEELKNSVQSVRSQASHLPKEEQVNQIQIDFDSKGLRAGILRLTIDKLADRVAKLLGRRPEFEGEEILQFGFDPLLNKLDRLLLKADAVEKEWYDAWIGEIDEHSINAFNSHILTIHTRLDEMQRNPMGFTDPQEQVWSDIFGFGKPFTEDGSVTPGFAQTAQKLIDVPYYGDTPSDELNEEERNARVTDIANKVANFNDVIVSLLTDNPIVVSQEEFGELEKFVTSTNEHWREEAVEAVARADVDLSELDRTFIVSAMYLLGLDADEEGVLEESVFSALKPSLQELQSQVEVLQAKVTFNRRVFAADTVGNTFSIPYTVEKEDGGLIEKTLLLVVDQKEEMLHFKTLVTVNGTPKLVNSDIVNLPNLENFYVLLRRYFAEENGTPIQNKNDLNQELKPWYATMVPGEEEPGPLSPHEEEEVSPAAIQIQDRIRRLQETGLGDASLESTDDKGKKGKGKGRQDVARVETIVKNIRKIPDRIPEGAAPEKMAKMLDLLSSDFVRYKKQLMKQASSQFIAIQNLIRTTKDTMLESDQMLPAFPRIVYQVYDNINRASSGWRSWKISKIEVVLNELRILIDNLEAKDKIEEQVRTRIESGLQGLPRATIDMIDGKFEELRRLVGVEV